MLKLMLGALVITGLFASTAMADYETKVINGQLMTKLPCGRLVPGNIGNDNSQALTYANLDRETRLPIPQSSRPITR